MRIIHRPNLKINTNRRQQASKSRRQNTTQAYKIQVAIGPTILSQQNERMHINMTIFTGVFFLGIMATRLLSAFRSVILSAIKLHVCARSNSCVFYDWLVDGAADCSRPTVEHGRKSCFEISSVTLLALQCSQISTKTTQPVAPPGGRGEVSPYGWTSNNYVICACFHCHGTSSYHTTNTLQGRRAKSHVDTLTIQPGLGDLVL